MKMYGLAIGLSATLSLAAGVAHAQQYFHGYLCSPDCSRDEVGYEWAAQHSITDPRDCDGITQGFIDGCQAWAAEKGTDAREDESAPDADAPIDTGNPDTDSTPPADDSSPG